MLMADFGVGGAHQIGRHQRRDQSRHREREEHRDRHCQAELDEILSGDAAHEGDGREDGDDGEGGGDDGEADFVGGLDGRAIGRLAHLDMPGDVLDLDDRVVDENAGRQRQRQEAHQIEREAQHVHDQKVGIADKGRATAEISVARQFLRNRKTTMTARIAPSTSVCKAAS